MSFHGRAAAHTSKITMYNDKRRLEWCKPCGVNLTSIGFWSSGNMVSGMMNHYLVVRQMNLCLVDSRRMLNAPMHSANCKDWRRRNNGLRLFFMVRAGNLSSSERKSQRCSIQLHSRWFCSFNFVTRSFPVSAWQCPRAHSKFHT
jgi:hypothetical protein